MDRGRKRSGSPRRKRINGVTRDRRDGVNRFKGHPAYFRVQPANSKAEAPKEQETGRAATPPSSGDTLAQRA